MADKWDRGLPERPAMQIPDLLRPYVALIRVGLWCLLAGGIFVAGWRMGADRANTKSAAEVALAHENARTSLAAANACGAALDQVSAETKLAEQRATEWKAASDAVAARASESARASQAQAAATESALRQAKQAPTCATQLAIEICPEVPLL